MANKTKKSNSTRRSRRQGTNGANTRSVQLGVLGMPVAWPGSSAVAPGRAHVRMVTEVFPTTDQRTFSKQGFTTWASQVHNILNSYKFFRVARATAEVLVSGGAASAYSVAFNISNAETSDVGVASLLNDDYAGVSTALLRPTLAPPKAYWDLRSRAWYSYMDGGDSGYIESNCVAGSVSLAGSGATPSTTVIGYLVVDLEIEFHTLA